MKLTLISGLSGSGKSIALKTLEDCGFFCVDNLPPALLPELAKWHYQNNQTAQLAVSVDVRSGISAERFERLSEIAKTAGIEVAILFLDAKNETLIRRFGETRRMHPLAKNHLTLPQAIEKEREILEILRQNAYVMDTTYLTPQQLVGRVRSWLGVADNSFVLTIESFGFKYGIPSDADFVFDVRELPNPYYDKNLREYTGLDTPIQNFFAQDNQAADLINELYTFLNNRIEKLKTQRNHLKIAIGCTGGKHRSVFVASSLAQRFQAALPVLLKHRQLPERE
ncbi:MAG: RNase adapter RapZ [Neisseriaceae bacterium]|nr:RNase adapter RapZ [Neisseriaceae bacterium]MBQ9724621.1 RNase adapter RapZ [Neisseriaceae bacterium]